MRYNFCSSPPNDAVGKAVYYFFGGAIAVVAVVAVVAFWPVILAAVCFYKMFK